MDFCEWLKGLWDFDEENLRKWHRTYGSQQVLLDQTTVTYATLMAVLSQRELTVPYFKEDRGIDWNHYHFGNLTKWNSDKLNCEHGIGGRMEESLVTFGVDWPGIKAVCGYHRCEKVNGFGKVTLPFHCVYSVFIVAF